MPGRGVLGAAEAVRRSAEDNLARAGSWQRRKMVANRERGEARRSDWFGDKTQRDGAWRGPQTFRVVDGGFMRQPWPGPVENGVGSGQRPPHWGQSQRGFD